MAEELKIIDPDLLTDVSETEINTLIEKMIEKSKDNMEEICELTLECTAFLSSAEGKCIRRHPVAAFAAVSGHEAERVASFLNQ